ncbi:NAD(P)-dependent dehydrogenase (short-subunit alcohol dehydrogenase family) [Spinactinospora alkalitolerans]|uniref:NAD(P)-dependent dehydrogenase (Short-subunit alcohol dehydrogenase family) n=1 Tax=Spinactinospora alkalitolerans TaxID=687207 RepID=A0A852TTA5_9ACTN|nr:SDR family oxidoreductase [Spinactinospora alkalitolerans]NYE45344.1 NAD(P)-dependent dehydrogenase (short-subunit alcohol dehydrogenase family) [Spinactinospora alkalitolerans]
MAGPFSIPGTTIVVTGGAGGIGYALAERFLSEGAANVVLADRDADQAKRAADELGERAHGLALDVADEAAVAEAVARIEEAHAPIDLWCSNAGVAAGRGLGDDADWDVSWRVHVLAHVYAARALFPRMAERGRGHLLVTASAAGLLTNLDTAPYSVTKHGAVALAEWLAIRHGDEGIDVSCLCPQGVNTAMTAGDDASAATRLGGDYLEPADVAEAVVAALHDGRFLILPHPEAAAFEQRRAEDRDRWIGGMRRAWHKIRRASRQG